MPLQLPCLPDANLSASRRIGSRLSRSRVLLWRRSASGLLAPEPAPHLLLQVARPSARLQHLPRALRLCARLPSRHSCATRLPRARSRTACARACSQVARQRLLPPSCARSPAAHVLSHRSRQSVLPSRASTPAAAILRTLACRARARAPLAPERAPKSRINACCRHPAHARARPALLLFQHRTSLAPRLCFACHQRRRACTPASAPHLHAARQRLRTRAASAFLGRQLAWAAGCCQLRARARALGAARGRACCAPPLCTSGGKREGGEKRFC
jgi:hypothetical protein